MPMPTLTTAYAALAPTARGGLVPLCELRPRVGLERAAFDSEVIALVRSGTHRIDPLDHPGRLDGRGCYTAEEIGAAIDPNGERWFFLSRIGE